MMADIARFEGQINNACFVKDLRARAELVL